MLTANWTRFLRELYRFNKKRARIPFWNCDGECAQRSTGLILFFAKVQHACTDGNMRGGSMLFVWLLSWKRERCVEDSEVTWENDLLLRSRSWSLWFFWVVSDLSNFMGISDNRDFCSLITVYNSLAWRMEIKLIIHRRDKWRAQVLIF